MSNWKFTDYSNRVVHRTNEDGSQESCLVEVIADWLAEGNEPEPADPIPPVIIPPISVSPWQMCKALLAMELLDDVEAAVATSDRITQLGWAKATEFVENDPFVVSMFAQFGKTDEERHALFELAASL